MSSPCTNQIYAACVPKLCEPVLQMRTDRYKWPAVRVVNPGQSPYGTENWVSNQSK